MNVSNVCYEAACDLSDGIPASEYCCDHSCCKVKDLGGKDAEGIYFKLIDRPLTSDVDGAAYQIHWPAWEFRVFLLLMASEALK